MTQPDDSKEMSEDELAARNYVRDGDCEVMDTYAAHEETFLAGLAHRDKDTRPEWAKFKAENARLTAEVKELENEISHLMKSQCPSTCYPPTTGDCEQFSKLLTTQAELVKALEWVREGIQHFTHDEDDEQRLHLTYGIDVILSRLRERV